MQNRQNGRRRGRSGGGGGGNPRPMGQQPNANRLEVRVRGNAHQLLEKYKQMARDAHQSGDRVAAEYYLQHADHYFRVLNDGRIRQEEVRARRGVFDPLDEEVEGEDEAMDVEADGDDARDGRRDGRDGQRREGGRDDRRFDQGDRQGDRRDNRDTRGDREMRDGREARDQHDQRDGRDQRDGGREAREPRDARDGRGERRRFDRGDRRERREERSEAPVANGDDRGANGVDRVAVSDGEAALAAFGGPIRASRAPEAEQKPLPLEPVAEAIIPPPSLETTVRQADSAVADVAADPAAEAAPAPRRRGRPRKVAADAPPVAEA